MIKEIKKTANNKVDFLNLQSNHLSIQLSLDGFSFCIYNSLEKDFGYFASYTFEDENITPTKHLALVKKLYQQEDILNLKYQSVTVSHYNNLVCQVPQPFFDKNNLAQYLQYSVKVLENDFIAHDTIYNTDIVNVYIPFVNINNFLLDKYGSFIYKHASTLLIEKLLNQYKNTKGDFCFVNVSAQYFEIVVVKNNQLSLYNCFPYKSKEDFIYYILFTAEQLNLNPETLKLVLLGAIEKESELYTIAYQYIRNVQFYKPVNSYAVTKNLSPHAYFTLLNQI